MSRIITHQMDRTNQKLYFARLMCEQAEQMKNQNIQLYQLYRESVVFHLYSAYTAFLQELINFYQLQNEPHLFDLESIEAALATKGQISPEINQLKQSMKEDFLRSIIQNYQASLYTPTSDLKQFSEQPMMIKTVQTTPYWLAEIEQLCLYYQQLLQMIESLRREMLEF